MHTYVHIFTSPSYVKSVNNVVILGIIDFRHHIEPDFVNVDYGFLC